MKATLKYDLTNDEDDFNLAVNSGEMGAALFEIFHELVFKYRAAGDVNDLLDEIVEVYERYHILKIIDGI